MATKNDNAIDKDDLNGQPSKGLKRQLSNRASTSDAVNEDQATKEQENMTGIITSTATAQWKKALSGALDESRLFCGLIVIGIFYIGYINVTAYHKSNTKDEDEIFRNCTCKSNHEKFYRALSAICWVIWLFIHCLLAIPQFKTYFCIKTMPDKNKLPCCGIRLSHCYKQIEKSQTDSQSSECQSSVIEIQPSINKPFNRDKSQAVVEKEQESVDEVAATVTKDQQDKMYSSCWHNCFSAKYQLVSSKQQQQQVKILDEISCCCLSVNNQALHESHESFDEIACCCCSFGCLQLDKQESKARNFYCCGIQCSCCCCCRDCCSNLYKSVKETLKSCYNGCFSTNKENDGHRYGLSKSFKKLMKMTFENKRINRYESYLWTKYYELYVVGAAKEEETITLKSIDDFVKVKSQATDDTDGDEPENKKNHNGENKKPSEEEKVPNGENSHYTSALSDSIEHPCRYIFHVLVHLVLFIFQFSAQFAVIPLFTLQIFDTYAFLCFTADNSCTVTDEYTLHFHQTLITFLFYCSLMVSFLASTMLRWITWPILKSNKRILKPDLEKGALTKSDTYTE